MKVFDLFYILHQIVVPVQVASRPWYKIALYYVHKYNQAISWKICYFTVLCQRCHKHMGLLLFWSVHFHSFGLVKQYEHVPREDILPVSLSSRTVPLFPFCRLRFFETATKKGKFRNKLNEKLLQKSVEE